MPILNRQYSGKRTNPDGSATPLSPSEALERRGPAVQVTVGIAQAFAQPLQQQGTALPTPVSGWALIDTGASKTCVDDVAAKAMGLPVIDVTNMTSASHHAVKQNVYPVLIEIVGTAIKIDCRAMGATLKSQGIVALIGRDALRHFTMFYNGPTGQITLSL